MCEDTQGARVFLIFGRFRPDRAEQPQIAYDVSGGQHRPLRSLARGKLWFTPDAIAQQFDLGRQRSQGTLLFSYTINSARQRNQSF